MIFNVCTTFYKQTDHNLTISLLLFSLFSLLFSFPHYFLFPFINILACESLSVLLIRIDSEN